uniref:Putative transmembrane protein n=1 Tax=Ralstonia solanacearum TaxID=305 RepID=A0A0S4TM19_RALSL|nr:putative transmembrane protein [Ralstonia solanacearum]
MAVMARRWWSGALGALACALLLACSPRYDWRTVQSAEGGYSVDYPGKPTAEARPVTIAGQRLPMTMQAASIDGTLFAVGVVELPADDPIWRQNAVAALRAGLAGNLRGHVATRDIAVKSAAQSPVSLPAVELVAQGTGGDDPAPRRLTARIVAAGRHAYQAVVLESGEAARDTRQQEQVDQFLASFHPY